IERACHCERRAVSRETGRQHAIEHVHPARDHLQKLRRRAESHGVTRSIGWQKWFCRFNRAHHFLFWFAHADSTNGVTIEIKLHDRLGALLAQILERSALDDAKQKLRVES